MRQRIERGAPYVGDLKATAGRRAAGVGHSTFHGGRVRLYDWENLMVMSYALPER
jgi:hypothetical protein